MTIRLDTLQSAVAELQSAVQVATSTIQELRDQLASDGDTQAAIDALEQQVYDDVNQLRDAVANGDQPATTPPAITPPATTPPVPAKPLGPIPASPSLRAAPPPPLPTSAPPPPRSARRIGGT